MTPDRPVRAATARDAPEIARARGLAVYWRLDEVPGCR